MIGDKSSTIGIKVMASKMIMTTKFDVEKFDGKYLLYFLGIIPKRLLYFLGIPLYRLSATTTTIYGVVIHLERFDSVAESGA